MLKYQAAKLVSLALVYALSITSPVTAQSSDPAWIEDLEFELAVNHECKVVAYLHMYEGKLGGQNLFSAKVKCEDGREFDASKTETDEEFSIRQCEVVSC